MGEKLEAFRSQETSMEKISTRAAARAADLSKFGKPWSHRNFSRTILCKAEKLRNNGASRKILEAFCF
jgi:hypothetical protein